MDRLGINTIVNRLNADPATYPSLSQRGWTVSTVTAILADPKYTGHQVFGRRRRIPSGRARRFRLAPREQWLWSPQPTHPAIITRALWEAAQDIGAEHAGSRTTCPLLKMSAAATCCGRGSGIATATGA